MSMTAAEIMEVVGKDQQPWWPPLMWGDGEWWTRAEAKHVMPDLAELAFIGAAVRELRKRSMQPVEIASYVGEGSVDYWEVGWANGWDDKRTKGPTELQALVAALNESEGV